MNGFLSTLRPGTTVIFFAQPPSSTGSNTQWPAVITVRGPANQPVPTNAAPVWLSISSAQIMRQGVSSVSRICLRRSVSPRMLSSGELRGLFSGRSLVPLTRNCSDARDG